MLIQDNNKNKPTQNYLKQITFKFVNKRNNIFRLTTGRKLEFE